MVFEGFMVVLTTVVLAKVRCKKYWPMAVLGPFSRTSYDIA